MKPNRLRQLLNEGKPTMGTSLVSPWPGMVEVVGRTGFFDYIEYPGEYSPYSLEQLDNFGRAIELFPQMSSMMKVEGHNRGFIATRAIDAGLQNVLFADCSSAEEVRECVRIVKPGTPQTGGTHGICARRGLGYMLDENLEACIKAMNDTVICIAIEDKEAVDHIEEVLSVPKIDMVIFGPMDYSVTIGKPGQRKDPEVIKAQDKVIETALKKGIAVRMQATSPDQVKEYLDIGIRHFLVGTDIRILFDWYKTQGEKVRKALAGA